MPRRGRASAKRAPKRRVLTQRSAQPAQPPPIREFSDVSNYRQRVFYNVAPTETQKTTIGSDLLYGDHVIGKSYSEFKLLGVDVWFVPTGYKLDVAHTQNALFVMDGTTSVDLTFNKIAISPGSHTASTGKTLRGRWRPHEPEDRNWFRFDNAHSFFTVALACQEGKVAGTLFMDVRATVRGSSGAVVKGVRVDPLVTRVGELENLVAALSMSGKP